MLFIGFWGEWVLGVFYCVYWKFVGVGMGLCFGSIGILWWLLWVLGRVGNFEFCDWWNCGGFVYGLVGCCDCFCDDVFVVDGWWIGLICSVVIVLSVDFELFYDCGIYVVVGLDVDLGWNVLCWWLIWCFYFCCLWVDCVFYFCWFVRCYCVLLFGDLWCVRMRLGSCKLIWMVRIWWCL